jgi:DMSO reductase anchor subunit
MTKNISNKIKNTRLNVTSAIYIGLAMIIGELIPFFQFCLYQKKVDHMDNIFTTAFPIIFNVVLLSTYKIVSFYQEVDDKLITSSEDRKHLKSKYIALYTEAILTIFSFVPAILWYVFLGFSLLAKTNIIIAVLILLVSCLILLILFFMTITHWILKLIKRVCNKT